MFTHQARCLTSVCILKRPLMKLTTPHTSPGNRIQMQCSVLGSWARGVGGRGGTENLHRFFLFSFFNVFLFLVALGLCCCPRAFSSCREQGLLFISVDELLIAVASRLVEHGL